MTDWKSRAVSADDVVRHVGSNTNVFIHGAAATPVPLVEALSKRRDVENVRLHPDAREELRREARETRHFELAG